MNKQNTLVSLEEIMKEHNIRMRKVKIVVKGEVIHDNKANLPKECVFSNWLNDENKNLKNILGPLFFGNLKRLNLEWYREYMKIYNIFLKKKQQGMILKLLSGSKVNEMDIDMAKMYYFDLEKKSDEFLKALGSSQRRLEALKEEKFY